MKLDPARRKKAEAYALQILSLVDPSGINAEAAKKAFARMTDEQLIVFVKGYRFTTRSAVKLKSTTCETSNYVVF